MENQDKLRLAQEFDTPATVEEVRKPSEPQKFVREIDTGDGRGKQRFEADTWEGLVDKLAEAQANATRKIGELWNQQQKRREPEKQSSDWQELKPSVLKAEDVIQLEKNPHELFRRMYLAEFGLTPDEARQRENERRRQEAEIVAQNEFVRKHKDYNPSPQNAEKIMGFLQQQNLPVSKHNLDYAYGELRDELVSKGQSNVAGKSEDSREPAHPQPVSPPPTFVRGSLGGRPATEETGGGFDAAEAARIAQLPLADMKARIEFLNRQSRSGR